MTSGLGVLSVTGPRSRAVLEGLTEARLDDGAFPFARAREIDVGRATALALRLSFTGELGWELYVPVESLPVLYDRLVAAGAAHGLRHAGYHALDGLRAEKGYVHWGADVGPADTPYEAGLGATVAMDKPGGFVGREALAAARTGPAGGSCPSCWPTPTRCCTTARQCSRTAASSGASRRAPTATRWAPP